MSDFDFGNQLLISSSQFPLMSSGPPFLVAGRCGCALIAQFASAYAATDSATEPKVSFSQKECGDVRTSAVELLEFGLYNPQEKRECLNGIALGRNKCRRRIGSRVDRYDNYSGGSAKPLRTCRNPLECELGGCCLDGACRLERRCLGYCNSEGNESNPSDMPDVRRNGQRPCKFAKACAAFVADHLIKLDPNDQIHLLEYSLLGDFSYDALYSAT